MKSKSPFHHAPLRRLSAVVVSISLCSVQYAGAATGTWNVGSGTTWATAASWLSSIPVGGSGFTENFTNNITADCAVTLRADKTITNIIFSDSNTSTAGSWILAHNGTSTNSLILAGVENSMTRSSGVVDGSISAAGYLTKAEVGTLTFSGANNLYQGGTIIGVFQGADVLCAAATQALGRSTVTLNALENGSIAQLELAGGIGILALLRRRLA